MTAKILYRVLIRLFALLLLVTQLPTFVAFLLPPPGMSDPWAPSLMERVFSIPFIVMTLVAAIPIYLFSAPKWLERLVIASRRDECENCGQKLVDVPEDGRCPGCGWHYQPPPSPLPADAPPGADADVEPHHESDRQGNE